jgi:hypothetical protein
LNRSYRRRRRCSRQLLAFPVAAASLRLTGVHTAGFSLEVVRSERRATISKPPDPRREDDRRGLGPGMGKLPSPNTALDYAKANRFLSNTDALKQLEEASKQECRMPERAGGNDSPIRSVFYASCWFHFFLGFFGLMIRAVIFTTTLRGVNRIEFARR